MHRQIGKASVTKVGVYNAFLSLKMHVEMAEVAHFTEFFSKNAWNRQKKNL